MKVFYREILWEPNKYETQINFLNSKRDTREIAQNRNETLVKKRREYKIKKIQKGSV